MNNAIQNTVDSAKDVIQAAGDLANQAVDDFGNVVTDGTESTIMDNTGFGATNSGETLAGYQLNDENKWGWITLYVVTIVIAILGNLLFVVASLCTKRTRTTGYYLLLNLSIRDIVLAGLCVPFTLDMEIFSYTWQFGDIFCRVYRFGYYAFLFFLPLTLLFLAWHLFVENCKWNFAGADDIAVPRPWPHTIFIPLIWFFSLAFAVPTVFFSEVRDFGDDFYRNEIAARPADAKICMHTMAGQSGQAANFFYIASFILTFLLPLILLFIPWWALLVQVFGCCTRKLRNSEFWLSIITLFLILIFEASRAPFELWNLHHILINNEFIELDKFIPGLQGESYKAVMKWAVYAPALLHPLIYFTFSPEARHGVYILFTRMCSCCCSKSGADVEVASDDEKGRMLAKDNEHGNAVDVDQSNVPLQSKREDEM